MRAKPASPVCARRTSPSTRPSRRVSSLSGRSLSIAMSISAASLACAEIVHFRREIVRMQRAPHIGCAARQRRVYVVRPRFDRPDRKRHAPRAHRRSVRARSGAGRAADVRVARLARRRSEGADLARCAGCAARARRSAEPSALDRGAVQRREGEPVRGAPRAAHGASTARRRADRRRWPRRHSCGPRDAITHAAAIRRRAPRPAARRDRQADTRARQSWHRRLGPRSAPRQRSIAAARRHAGRGRIRLERRSGATVADARPARSGNDAVRRHVEDVHDAGDARQCDCRARLARVRDEGPRARTWSP